MGMVEELTTRSPRYSHLTLCLSLVLLIVLGPLNKLPLAGIFLRLYFNCLLLSAIYMLSSGFFETIAGTLLAAPGILLSWAGYLFPSPLMHAATFFIYLLFLAFVIFVLLRRILVNREVDSHLVFGAISTYLLIGVFWACLYGLVETMAPGSLEGITAEVDHRDFISGNFGSLLYYSFVTLTTLGYGDITPDSSAVRMFASLEAIIGQFYLAVLVGGLVAFLVRKQEKK